VKHTREMWILANRENRLIEGGKGGGMGTSYWAGAKAGWKGRPAAKLE